MLPSISTLRVLRSCARLNVPSHLRTLATETTTLPLTQDHPSPPESSTSPSRGISIKKADATPSFPGAKEGALRPHLNVPVDPKHGLWAFFRKVKKEDGEIEHESMERVRMYLQIGSGAFSAYYDWALSEFLTSLT